MHFLISTLYDQIEVLEKQGRGTEAASLASFEKGFQKESHSPRPHPFRALPGGVPHGAENDCATDELCQATVALLARHSEPGALADAHRST